LDVGFGPCPAELLARAGIGRLKLVDRDIRVSLAQARESHYDIELIFPHPSGPKRAYVEVKGSERMDRLVRRVNQAFKGASRTLLRHWSIGIP